MSQKVAAVILGGIIDGRLCAIEARMVHVTRRLGVAERGTRDSFPVAALRRAP